jgi:hypothetical protein
LQLLNLGTERLEVHFWGFFEYSIGHPGLYEIELSLGQAEGAQRLADGQAQGIERFLFIGCGFRSCREGYGGPKAKHGYQTGGNDAHELSFLLYV